MDRFLAHRLYRLHAEALKALVPKAISLCASVPQSIHTTTIPVLPWNLMGAVAPWPIVTRGLLRGKPTGHCFCLARSTMQPASGALLCAIQEEAGALILAIQAALAGQSSRGLTLLARSDPVA
jgi:hypothetical protein